MSDYDERCGEIDEAEAAERREYERQYAAKGFGVCKFDGGLCHTKLDLKVVGKVFPCFVFGINCEGRFDVTYVCCRVRLKGGVGYGMSLQEKLKRQGLLPDGR